MKTIDITTVVNDIVKINEKPLSEFWVHLQLQKLYIKNGGTWSRELPVKGVELLLNVFFEKFPTLTRP